MDKLKLNQIYQIENSTRHANYYILTNCLKTILDEKTK